ncbi:758_t:CDS:2, partial [Dentiscutata heterogama]
WVQILLDEDKIQKFDSFEFGVYSVEYRGTKITLKRFIIPKFVNELYHRRFTINCHENIIKFLGITITFPENNYLMVLQFANDGNLRNHLQSKTHEGVFKILRTELIQIAEQIIFG